ncbi:MAG TPA: Ig-like domain-containing protein [Bryobacteraceae bacterium]
MRKFTTVLFCSLLATALQAQSFISGQAARAVMGQTVFTTGDSAPSDTILGGASGLAYDPVNHRLYVADSNRIGSLPQNHRVLVFDTNKIPEAHVDITTVPDLASHTACYLCGFSAVNSLGQSTFLPPDTSSTPPVFDPGLSADPSQPQFNGATAVATNGSILAVADTDNNRILIWTSMPAVMNQPPNLVLGQPDFTTRAQPGTGVVSPTILRGPQGVWIQGTRLFVADTQNHRILIWNNIPTTNNQAPDLVLGQSDFTHAEAPPPGPTDPPAFANRLLNPVSVTSDGTHVFVADLGFNRVLIWNSIPTANDQPADVVLGQPDMTKSTANNSAVCNPNAIGLFGACSANLNFPRYALSDGHRLFVADGGNDRVLIYNSIPTANAANADIVLGEPDFTTNIVSSQTISITSTAIDNTGAVDVTPTPTSLAFDGTNLYVADPYNRRVLVFTPGDQPLPGNSVVNWASEIIRQEGIVVLTVPSGGAVTANDKVTISIASKPYDYTVKNGDNLDSVAKGLVASINASDPNATAIYAGNGTGTIYLSSKGTNLPYDSILLSVSSSNAGNITLTPSGSYLTAGTAATGSPGALMEVNAPPGVSLSDNTAVAPTTGGNIPGGLGGVQIYMDGVPVPVLRVSPSQVVGQVPFFFNERNSTSVYVRTVHNDGRVTVTNATPVYIAPANPGIFNAPAFSGQQRPWPASLAFHQSGNPTSVVDVGGSIQANDIATITVNGRNYSYTVKSGDTLSTVVDGLVAAIAPDPDVTAAPGGAFTRVVLTAKQSGAAGNGISIAASQSPSTAAVLMTAYTTSTCCAVQPNTPITPENPAGPGELITIYTAGMGLVTDRAGNIQILAAGAPYNGAQPNTVYQPNFATATMGGSTAQVINAGFAAGSYGMYQLQVIVPNTLAANPATQFYVAQNAFISNIVTVPVGTPTLNPPPPPPPPSKTSLTITVDSPAPGAPLSGAATLYGWAIDTDTSISGVTYTVDGASYGPASYGGSRTDVCAVFPGRAGCPNVGWSAILDTTRLSNGSHTLQVTATNSRGVRFTVSQAFTVSNDLSASPTKAYIDSPVPNNNYRGAATFWGWALNDAPSAISSVSVSIDGIARGNATYGQSRGDVCAIFPNGAGCPDVGWSFFFDTSTLSNGTHTFSVTATAANGQKTTVANPFIVSSFAPDSPVRITFDAPGASSGAYSGNTSFNGWAIDDLAAIGSLSFSVDGVPYTSGSYGSYRQDVCDVFPGRAGCPNVGWTLSLDTTRLADGTHTLAITAHPMGGQSYTATAAFQVANLATTANPVRIDIDTPGPSGPALGGVAAISGWAVSDNAPVSDVQILVDGIPSGTAIYGSARGDVCVVHPGSPDCPKVGWTAMLDTSGLTSGLHTLSVTATSTIGQRATNSRAFQVNNTLSGPGRLGIDQPTAGNSYLGSVQFNGWAVHSSLSVTAVSITIDGVPYGSATYGGNRSDVCATYPGPSCPGIGWTFALDTTQLADGPHTLGATEIASDGSHYTASAAFTVANFSNVNPMRITVDSPAPSVYYSDSINLYGWAIDDTSPISSVSIAVDGVPQLAPISYGGARPDVCDAFPGRAGCPNVGWSTTLDTTLFSNGAHTLAVTATTPFGQSSTVNTSFQVVN